MLLKLQDDMNEYGMKMNEKKMKVLIFNYDNVMRAGT